MKLGQINFQIGMKFELLEVFLQILLFHWMNEQNWEKNSLIYRIMSV
jgi:hypothetical protein